MKLSLIIIFIIIYFETSQDSQVEKDEINTFINYIQQKRLWEIFYNVKVNFGTDVAIGLCKDYTHSPYWEEVVREYMSDGGAVNGIKEGEYLNKSELYSFLEEKNYLTILKKEQNSKINDKSEMNSKIYFILVLILSLSLIIFLLLSLIC